MFHNLFKLLVYMKAELEVICFQLACGWKEVPPLPNYLTLSLGSASLDQVPDYISLKRRTKQSEEAAAMCHRAS